MAYKDIKKINPFELESGMVLAKDLSINNIKLLNKDILLTEKNIERIQNLYSTSAIYVYSEIEDYEMQIIKNKNSEKFKETESSFSRFSDNAEKIFTQVTSSSKLEINNIRNLSEDILTEMKDYGIIIRNIIDSRNPDTYLFRHSVNVAALSAMLGKWLELPSRDIMLLTYAGILHDIGKSKIPLDILNKRGTLTTKEFNIVKTHPIKSYEIVKTIPYIDPTVEMAVLMHHERIDGSGYPLRLKDEKIHLYAKIVSVADVFDAMTSNRVYSSKNCPLQVLETMKDEAFGKLDPRCCTTFIKNMCNFYIGEYVLLNNDVKAKILRINDNYISKPLVAIGEDCIDLSIEKDIHIVDIL